jgi:hypothetical protein
MFDGPMLQVYGTPLEETTSQEIHEIVAGLTKARVNCTS